MMETTIPILSGLCKKIETNHDGYANLVNFYLACKQHTDCKIFIDIRQLEWIDANMSALLHAIIHKLSHDNKIYFSIDTNIITNKFNILYRNGFLYHLNPVNNWTKSAIELSTFSKIDADKFYKYVTQRLLSHDGLRISASDKTELTSAFLEIFTNVELHAETDDPIFACGQYYPKKSKLNFTLLDLGVGYLPKIKAITHGEIQTAKQAIAWALAEGNTTKKKTKGGDGLSDIFKFCKTSKRGHLHIATGDAYWYGNYRSQLYYEIPHFEGSFLNLSFDC